MAKAQSHHLVFKNGITGRTWGGKEHNVKMLRGDRINEDEHGEFFRKFMDYIHKNNRVKIYNRRMEENGCEK